MGAAHAGEGEQAAIYTGSDAVVAAQRLAEELLQDPAFEEYCQVKGEQAGGVPTVETGSFENTSTSRGVHATLEILRDEMLNTLRKSGRLVPMADSRGGDCVMTGRYMLLFEGSQAKHRVSIQLVDSSSGRVIWMGSDETVKQ